MDGGRGPAWRQSPFLLLPGLVRCALMLGATLGDSYPTSAKRCEVEATARFASKPDPIHFSAHLCESSCAEALVLLTAENCAQRRGRRTSCGAR